MLDEGEVVRLYAIIPSFPKVSVSDAVTCLNWAIVHITTSGLWFGVAPRTDSEKASCV